MAAPAMPDLAAPQSHQHDAPRQLTPHTPQLGPLPADAISHTHAMPACTDRPVVARHDSRVVRLGLSTRWPQSAVSSLLIELQRRSPHLSIARTVIR